MAPLVRFGIGAWVSVMLCSPGGRQNAASFSYIYTQTSSYDREPAVAGGERFSKGARLRLMANGTARDLVPGFAASADASASFDGLRVLFSGKQNPADSWHVWEVAVAGGAPRQITTVREDTIAPLYLSEGQIVYARRTRTGFQLETVLLSGGDPTRLTYGPGDHVPTAVLRDGRILFDGPGPQTSRGRDVFAVYADGTGVESYRCDHSRDRHSGIEVASGDIVFESAGKLARFTSARAVQIDLPPTPGEFAGRIAEISPGEWLVSYRPDSREPFGLYRWRTDRGVPEQLLRANDFHAVQPVAVRSREIPKRHPSSVGNREGANLLCLNAYTSHLRIPSGAVASVRVWALDDAGAAVALGNAPVEEDGSFFVQTPSERAIRFELLDRSGATVAAEKRWFWARRGEQRVCVGCHAGPERAPENAVPATLLRSNEPAKLLLPPQSKSQETR